MRPFVECGECQRWLCLWKYNFITEKEASYKGLNKQTKLSSSQQNTAEWRFEWERAKRVRRVLRVHAVKTGFTVRRRKRKFACEETNRARTSSEEKKRNSKKRVSSCPARWSRLIVVDRVLLLLLLPVPCSRPRRARVSFLCAFRCVLRSFIVGADPTEGKRPTRNNSAQSPAKNAVCAGRDRTARLKTPMMSVVMMRGRRGWWRKSTRRASEKRWKLKSFFFYFQDIVNGWFFVGK